MRRRLLRKIAAEPIPDVPIDPGLAANVTPQEDWDEFERLPASVREACNNNLQPPSLRAAINTFKSVKNAGMSDSFAATYTVQKLRTAEAMELSHFAKRYQDEHRQPHPHTAAGARILRRK